MYERIGMTPSKKKKCAFERHATRVNRYAMTRTLTPRVCWGIVAVPLLLPSYPRSVSTTAPVPSPPPSPCGQGSGRDQCTQPGLQPLQTETVEEAQSAWAVLPRQPLAPGQADAEAVAGANRPTISHQCGESRGQCPTLRHRPPPWRLARSSC